jgi:hypothetical protein
LIGMDPHTFREGVKWQCVEIKPGQTQR